MACEWCELCDPTPSFSGARQPSFYNFSLNFFCHLKLVCFKEEVISMVKLVVVKFEKLRV